MSVSNLVSRFEIGVAADVESVGFLRIGGTITEDKVLFVQKSVFRNGMKVEYTYLFKFFARTGEDAILVFRPVPLLFTC